MVFTKTYFLEKGEGPGFLWLLVDLSYKFPGNFIENFQVI